MKLTDAIKLALISLKFRARLNRAQSSAGVYNEASKLLRELFLKERGKHLISPDIDPTQSSALYHLRGQIKAFLGRSEQYFEEAQEEKDVEQGEIHGRVTCVLKELDRLAEAFQYQEREDRKTSLKLEKDISKFSQSPVYLVRYDGEFLGEEPICLDDFKLVKKMNPNQKQLDGPEVFWPAWALRDAQLLANYRRSIINRASVEIIHAKVPGSGKTLLAQTVKKAVKKGNKS